MRSLQRILVEKRTRHLLDHMLHKYADIQLSAASRGARRRRRPSSSSHEGLKAPSPPVDARKQQPEDGEQDEDEDGGRESRCLSECRTVSTFGSLPSPIELAVQQSPREQDADAELSSSSEGQSAPTSRSSALSSTRLALEQPPLEAEQEQTERKQHDPELETQQQTQVCAPEGDGSSSSDAASPTAASRLPRLRAEPPIGHVRANCCDFFPSAHPHYLKEEIAKSGDSALLRTNSASTETLTEGEESACRGHEGHESSDANADANADADTNDEAAFDMWDYVCPQYLRKVYANEWV